MADTVSTQVIEQGERNYIVKLTNKSDGTGESAVLKIDVSALSPAPDGVSILGMQYDINNMEVELLWDADTDVTIVKLASGQGALDFSFSGGLHNNAGAGKTGDLKLTTSGQSSGSSYSIILYCKKKYD